MRVARASRHLSSSNKTKPTEVIDPEKGSPGGAEHRRLAVTDRRPFDSPLLAGGTPQGTGQSRAVPDFPVRAQSTAAENRTGCPHRGDAPLRAEGKTAFNPATRRWQTPPGVVVAAK